MTDGVEPHGVDTVILKLVDGVFNIAINRRVIFVQVGQIVDVEVLQLIGAVEIS